MLKIDYNESSITNEKDSEDFIQDENDVSTVSNSTETNDILSNAVNDNLNPYEHVKSLRNLNPQNIIISHLNVNSMHAKFPEITELLSQSRFDV